MDAKDLRTESNLDSRSHDGTNKYSQSATAISCNRNKSYHDDGSNSLGKVEVPSTRPCAVIGPDRVVPPSAAADPFPKKPPPDQWMFADPIYRRPPDYPMKMTNYQNQTRNISPRQTFQENMQRIMMPPTYNSVKMSKDLNLSGDGNLVPMPKSSKMNISTEAKYCDVPYNVSPLPTEQKNIRDVNVPSVSAINQSAPYGWNTSNTVRPTRPYGAPELYQYPDYPGSAGSRTMPVGRPVRNFHEETPSVFPERFFSDGNIRYKPYPQVKEGYAQPRYDCINNYPNPYHPPPYPPPRYDIQKSHNPHLYSTYSQVPVKYFDNRMNEPVIDGYQRSNPQPNYNVSYPNQFIHPAYGPVPGNINLQNKLLPYPSDMPIKANTLNKMAYENKLFTDFENVRNKQFVPENYYGPKSQIMISKPHMSNIQNTPGHPYYRKDYPSYRNYDPTKYGEMTPNIGNASLRFPSQFSPNVMGMSPLESNDHMHSLLLEDSNYVSHPTMSSMRCADQSLNRIHPDMFIRHDPKFAPMRRQMPSRNDTNNSGNVSAKDKKNIDVRQFLQQWNDDDDNNVANNPKQEVVQNVTDAKLTSEQEQLYVLGLVNVPSDELGKYDHIQKISKLPDNIKGYSSLELLNQFEEAIECSNMNNMTTTKPRNYERNYKTMPIQRAAVPPLQRPMSPLDVEAKISQSVIHKEVGCNFEIKPCSPKMLNVEIAAPAQTVLNERVIEKLSNPHISESPNNSPMVETLSFKGNRQDQEILVNNKNPSCKMNQNQFSKHNYTVPAKNDYSLSDLESSSGVCLASLPRLDNEIELNFPEVNQQFINANAKTDTVITTINSDNVPETTQSKESVLVSPGQLSPNIDTSQKLCKFRKSKKEGCELNSEVITHTKAVRTDSVIIKNPDTVKEYGCCNDSAMIFSNMDLQNSEKLENNDDKDPNIALDFSVNKYSFGYDENKLEDDFNEHKNISSPKICENSEIKQDLILEPNIKAENITKETLNPETSESEVDSKIQDPTFLLESSDLEPEQRDIDKHNFADVQLLSDNESETGSSDDSNSKFCEVNIISHETVIKEEVEVDLEKVCFVKGINPNTLEGTDEEQSQEIPTLLNKEGSEITNVLSESVIGTDIPERLIDTKSSGSPTTQRNLKTQDELEDFMANASDSNEFDEQSSSKMTLSEIEPETIVPIESCQIYEIGGKDTCNYIVPTNSNYQTKSATDNTIISETVEKTLLSEENEQSKDRKRVVMMDNDEITSYSNQDYVTNETVTPIRQAELKTCHCHLQNDKTENNIKQGIKKTNVEDISLITGICFTALSLELYKKPSTDLNEGKVFDDLDNPILNISPGSENNSAENHNNVLKSFEGSPSRDCNTLAVQDHIDSKFSNTVDRNVNQKLQEHFQEEEKQFDNINEIESQNSILPVKLAHPDSLPKSPSFDIDNNVSNSETYSTDFAQEQNENCKISTLSEIAPICLSEKITSNGNNATIETLASDSALINYMNTDCLTPLTDFDSENNIHNNKTVSGNSVKQLSNHSNNKHFSLKLFSPHMYNLTMYETGTCTSLFKMKENTEENLGSEAKSNFQTLRNVSDISNNSSDVSSCNYDICMETTSKSLLSAREDIPILKTDHLPQVTNTHIEMETCIILNTSNDNNDEEIFTSDNNQMSLTNLERTELYQVVSLKDIVTKFLDHRYPNLDLKSINNDFQTLETSTSVNVMDTTQTKPNIPNTRPSEINLKNKHNHEKIKRYMKRSLSESDLDNYEHTENSHSVNNIKRQKIYTKNDLETELIEENIILHNNRRNSISTILNEEDVSFCILIDDNCIISEECEDFDRNSTVEDSECFEYVETELDIDENGCNENSPCLLPIADLKQTKYPDNDILNNYNEHQSDEGAWIEDVACVETVVSDNVAEDIEVGSGSSPLNESISDYNSDGESSYSFNNNFNDHAEKVKHIYEGCHDNDRLMETLFRTPQMNVNKTLVKDNQDVDHCIDQERADLENMLSESMTVSKTNVSDVTTLARDSLIEARSLAPHSFNEEMQMAEPTYQIDTDDDNHINPNVTVEKSQSAFVHSCESSFDNVFSYNELTENTTQYSSSSSSPEVSSTTSEEKCSSILLKITSYNGSIVSEISNSREIKRISCKYTEKNDYNSANSNRPLITKAAQKYIPPISETIQDLKVKLPLPQHSLLKLQQLKHSKEQLKPENSNRYFPLRPDIPKKPKPKFEDVLKSIDDIQFKMHKEKKKIKKYIPKVVIKKNGNGSHYTSSSSHERFDPDLTGLKWQPWVFIERNGFIDKMATTRKTEAIYSHRKKEYVFRDKFQKYKSVSSAKFVITQPKLDDKGLLKYTIKLKHNY